MQTLVPEFNPESRVLVPAFIHSRRQTPQQRCLLEWILLREGKLPNSGAL